MKYILNYKEFLEARIFDMSKIKLDSDSKLYKDLVKIPNIKFENDCELLKKFTSKKYFNKNKITLDIKWNNHKDHDMIKRIKERTNFKSTNEFNIYIKLILNKIYPDHINDMVVNGKYCFYDSEYNISIIIFKNDNYLKNIKIITIINGLNDFDVVDVIYL